MEEALIEIKVHDRGFFGSKLVGYFPISSPTVYHMKDHTVHNQMIALTNPEGEDKSHITGYITVSMNLQGPGDESILLEAEKSGKTGKPWMPPSVEKLYKQLYMRFLKAENLPIMDTFGTIDAYIYVELAKKSTL